MSNPPTSTNPLVPAAPAADGETRFYNGRDLAAFGLTAAIAFAGYVCTLAPSVGVGDSGELVTAAYSLGVPHAPGYPAWTLLAWLWQRLIPWGNIAWRVNLMSAFFGALAMGYLALLISKGGHVMTTRPGPAPAPGRRRALDALILASAVSAGLMMAFSPVMWSQSVTVKVSALDAFLLLVTLELLYRWSFRPERRGLLYLAAFVWGVGLTGHQYQVLLAVAFPIFIGFVDGDLGRDALVPVLCVLLVGALVPERWLSAGFGSNPPAVVGIVLAVLKLVPDIVGLLPGKGWAPFTGAVGLALGIWAGWRLYVLLKSSRGLTHRWSQVLRLYGAVLLGLSFYLYEPLSSATNPPMNWGYTRTAEGFLHHATRGEYDKVQAGRGVLQCWGQLNLFCRDLQTQFGVVFALVAMGTLLFYRELQPRDRHWLKFTLVAFLWLALGYLYLANPNAERQQQISERVFFLPAHYLYALWIGFGLILGGANLLARNPRLQPAALPLALVIGLLPLYSVWRSWAGAEQRHHEFGYQLGYLMFKPGSGYPEMEQNAVLYGTADSGRFAPTYLIMVESQVPPAAKTRLEQCPDSGTFDRRDVAILAQDALVHPSYLSYARDHYAALRPDPGSPATLTNRTPWQRWLLQTAWKPLGRDRAYPRTPLWLPSEVDRQAVLAQYVQDLRNQPAQLAKEVQIENGQIRIKGMQGRLAVNGMLSRMVFDRNKDRHTFFVEGSHVLPWMYPYLEPYGLILKFNSEPLAQFEPGTIERDQRYWTTLFKQLDTDPRFHRDAMAQQAFARARTSIGSLYAARGLPAEAEGAYQQAVRLCRASPEANFSLAQLYIQNGQFEPALELLRRYQETDPHDSRILQAINAVHDLQQLAAQEKQLEQRFASEPNNIPLALQLFAVYARRQRVEAMDSLVHTLTARSDISPNDLLELAQTYMGLRRLDRVLELLTFATQRFPANATAWYNLALVNSVRNDCPAALSALGTALSLEPPNGPIHQSARSEAQFGNCRKDPRFETLLNQTVSIPNAGGFTVGH